MLARTPEGLTGSTADFDTLLQAWLDHIPRIRELREAHRAAVALMPWWAQPGPKRVRGDGVLSGDVTAIPALQEFTMPDASNVSRTIRPSEYDFRQRYENPVYGSRERAAETLKMCLDRLAEREAAREIERKKAGVNRTDYALRRAGCAWHRDWQRIADLGPSPSQLAFHSLRRIIDFSDGGRTFGQECEHGSHEMWRERIILRQLIPALSPLVRATVERAIKPSAGPMRRWAYWLGRELPYTGGGDPPAEMIQPWRPADEAA